MTMEMTLKAWRHSSQISGHVSALNYGTSGPGSSPGQGHRVVFLLKTLNSHSACLYLGRVVRRLDNAIHRINRYPVDKC